VGDTVRKALIVWGGWDGHQPERGAQLIQQMLTADGFTVESTPDFKAFGRTDLQDFSLVVPNITWHTSLDTPVTGEAIDNLVAAIRSGVGFATFHGSAIAFPTHVNYHFMMGSQWVQHPGNNGVDYRVHIEKPFDPVEGIADFAYKSEQYYLHVDPSIEVLATTLFTGEHDDAVTGIKMPAVYKRQFGKGRVFYSSLGHSPAEFDAFPASKTILRRGLNWAAR
jgi:type 1 glutamine amidotransferase